MPHISKNENEKIQKADLKWIKLMVEPDHMENVLNKLEDTKYELFQVIDGNIWLHVILRKRDSDAKRNTKTVSTQQ